LLSSELIHLHKITLIYHVVACKKSVVQQINKMIYRKKCLKDHAAIMVFIGICIIGVFISGVALRKYLLGYSAIVMLIIGHVWRYNIMMAYIEKHVYNDN